LTRTARVMGTWDDHDYGADDSGVHYKPREASKEIFLDFFDEPSGSERRSREGIYTSAMLGDAFGRYPLRGDQSGGTSGDVSAL